MIETRHNKDGRVTLLERELNSDNVPSFPYQMYCYQYPIAVWAYEFLNDETIYCPRNWFVI
jgi:hypothetical protein